MTLDELLSYFPDRPHAKKSGDGYTLRCPAHEDKDPSLSISQDGDHLLVHCHAGCSTDEILDAVGLKTSDLFIDSKPTRKHSQQPTANTQAIRSTQRPLPWFAEYTGVPVDSLKSFGVTESRNALNFTFGGLAVVKVRRIPKGFSWSPKDCERPELWPLPEPELPETIWLCEGESDTVCARYVGLAAYSITAGVGTPLSEDALADLYRRGVRGVILALDNDDAADAALYRHVDAIEAAGLNVQRCDLSLLDGKLKDIRDAWLRMSGDREAARESFDACVVELDAEQDPDDVVLADLLKEEARQLEYLPFLGHSHYIARGWCTLIAGYPKVGKTELLIRLCRDWEHEKVLYLSEEPREVWRARVRSIPGPWEHVTVSIKLGTEYDAMVSKIRRSRASVVVIDTIRTLLCFSDETDNSEISRVLAPILQACRDTEKTCLLVHHMRKGGGSHGEGVAGGHSFLGTVDAMLSVEHDGNENRRKVTGLSRIITIEELLYERENDGSFTALGNPAAVRIENLKQVCLDLLTDDWKKLSELFDETDAPKPSKTQLRNALDALVSDGSAERNPSEQTKGATYKYRRAGTL